MVEIRAELEQTGTLNAKKQREKILKLLDKWYPQINAFEAKLKPYDEQLQRMRDELDSLPQHHVPGSGCPRGEPATEPGAHG